MVKNRICGLIILAVLAALTTGCIRQEDIKAAGLDEYRISLSQDGEKEIYCTEDGKLILVSGGKERLIYEDYREISSNPYSVWNFDEYKIQWSEDSNYVYIIDSIYDFRNDALIPIKDCVIFSWIGNKGVFLSEGTYYEISYDGALQNQTAAGKKLKIIEAGKISELGVQTGDRYYILAGAINSGKAFDTLGDYIIIESALLKYSEEQLQDKINEELHSEAFREFLRKKADKLEEQDALMDKIKGLEEFKALQSEIESIEKNYPMEYYGPIKDLIGIVNDGTKGYFNVSGKYFLRDIKCEELRFR